MDDQGVISLPPDRMQVRDPSHSLLSFLLASPPFPSTVPSFAPSLPSFLPPSRPGGPSGPLGPEGGRPGADGQGAERGTRRAAQGMLGGRDETRGVDDSRRPSHRGGRPMGAINYLFLGNHWREHLQIFLSALFIPPTPSSLSGPHQTRPSCRSDLLRLRDPSPQLHPCGRAPLPSCLPSEGGGASSAVRRGRGRDGAGTLG